MKMIQHQPLTRRKLDVVALLALLALLPWGALAWSGSEWKPKHNQPTTLPNDDLSTTTPCSRRAAISKITASVGGLLLIENSSLPSPQAAYAAADDSTSTIYTRQQTISKQDVGWQIQLPAGMKEGAKPVKTHLDEINFSSETTPRYQYGVTVDPVRISTIAEFGTPEEVAARVVTAEVNRDGVFEVTLLEDPIATADKSAYILEYISSGKRGKKVYLNKIFVSNNKLLYVLTAQCKVEDYASLKSEMKRTVQSFQIL